MEKSGCVRCAAPLPVRGRGRGRPASYCSTACRRAAEFAIRRLSGRLDALEAMASGLRMKAEGEHEDFYSPQMTLRYRKQWKRQLAAVGAELGRTEQRLRALLAAGGTA